MSLCPVSDRKVFDRISEFKCDYVDQLKITCPVLEEKLRFYLFENVFKYLENNTIWCLAGVLHTV